MLGFCYHTPRVMREMQAEDIEILSKRNSIENWDNFARHSFQDYHYTTTLVQVQNIRFPIQESIVKQVTTQIELCICSRQDGYQSVVY